MNQQDYRASLRIRCLTYNFSCGSGHFVVDGKVVDATYWTEANFPKEYFK